MAIGEFTTLTGLEVEQIWVWKSYLRLVFELGARDRSGIFVDLTDFRYIDAAKNTWDVRVEDDPATAGPVLGVLNHRVTAAQIRNWELTLTFDTGAYIACPPQAAYEAWAACLPDARWDCPPGASETDWPHP
ncbi:MULTISPECIES: DUF6188 family protein [unclassified Nocardia]|uniref:DUF6188 family protein n=1 Tax=unclassified Nocardia TaxID=2637762 RepID=UPI0024A83711|nr:MULTISPECIES: DUF6188 family protein [unclassified Nocardia]